MIGKDSSTLLSGHDFGIWWRKLDLGMTLIRPSECCHRRDFLMHFHRQIWGVGLRWYFLGDDPAAF